MNRGIEGGNFAERDRERGGVEKSRGERWRCRLEKCAEIVSYINVSVWSWILTRGLLGWGV